ncbi:MAG: ATPase [Parcubacteria group bacterium Gr01-1014_3]|nr:MAG: ATPase [Parcubacteria group bacterium Gr01-1014_3]
MGKDDELVRLNTKDMGPKVKEFLTMLSRRVKGQDMALRDVATAYEQYTCGLKKKDKPIFSGLFLGPSGVGKTLVAEILAEHLFGSRGAFCKIKCEDFKERHQIASLIGSPPGYIGFQDPNDEKRFNEESTHPILSQWNLDRHDSKVLQVENKDERDKFMERKKKYDKDNEAKQVSEEIRRIKELVNKLERDVDVLEGQQSSAPKDKAGKWRIAAKVTKLKKELLALKAQGVVLSERLKKAKVAYEEERAYLQKWYRSMADRGAVYDSDAPRTYTSIVLFDEIEKADESLHHMLYEIMDKGELQLANGRTTSFRNCFLFMTGNVGEREIADIQSGNANIGFRQQGAKNEAEENQNIYQVAVEAAKKTFPAAFMGRLDKIVVFRPLKFETLIEILDVHVNELIVDFFEADQPILITLEDPVKKFLVEQSMEGGRNAYGARNLKARLGKYITSKLIRAIGNGSLKPPADVFAKLEEVNGKKRVVFDSMALKFPGEDISPKTNGKTNP